MAPPSVTTPQGTGWGQPGSGTAPASGTAPRRAEQVGQLARAGDGRQLGAGEPRGGGSGVRARPRRRGRPVAAGHALQRVGEAGALARRRVLLAGAAGAVDVPEVLLRGPQ